MRAREEDLVVQSSDMALFNIASLHDASALDLSPRYQRRNRWDRERQSQLIESFLLNVPVPPVYLAEESRGVYAVIDGKQRLTAITQFLHNEFSLAGMALRLDLEGRRYADLDAEDASALGMRPLRAVTILRQTPDWVKHEVFVRLNRGGQPLNAQEIRNVAYAGPLNDRIIALAENRFLRQQLKIASEASAAYADMSDVEMTVRFFALAESWQTFGGSMRVALDAFMQENYTAGPSRIRDLENRFERALFWCEHLWGDRAFRRHDGSQWRDQMIGGVFDAEMVAVDRLSDTLLETWDPEEVVRQTMYMFRNEQFDTAVRLSTNTSTRVRVRIAMMTDLLAQ